LINLDVSISTKFHFLSSYDTTKGSGTNAIGKRVPSKGSA